MRTWEEIEILPPKNLIIELSSFCNLDCIFCCYGFRKKEYLKFMDRETIDKSFKVANEIESLYPGRIDIDFVAIGEELMAPNYLYALEQIKKYNLPMLFFTNCVSVPDEIIDSLLEVKKIKIITLDIYGSNQENYKQITGRDHYDKVVENANKFVDKYIQSDCSTPCFEIKMMRTPYGGIEEFRKTWKPAIQRLRKAKPEGSFELNTSRATLFPEGIHDEMFLGHTTVHGANCGCKVQETKDDRYLFHFCDMPFENMTIFPNGEISICCTDANHRINLGNINTDNLPDVWDGKQLNLIREKLINGEKSGVPLCSNCYFKVHFGRATRKWIELRGSKRSKKLLQDLDSGKITNPS